MELLSEVNIVACTFLVSYLAPVEYIEDLCVVHTSSSSQEIAIDHCVNYAATVVDMNTGI